MLIFLFIGLMHLALIKKGKIYENPFWDTQTWQEEWAGVNPLEFTNENFFHKLDIYAIPGSEIRYKAPK